MKAPELRINDWIDGDGIPMDNPVRLANLGEGYKILYCFQHWCPSCHSRGFPTLRKLYDKLQNKGFGFAVIQTVFEGSEINTYDKLRVNQEKYSLKIPFGHDTPPTSKRYPTFMEDYRTSGTPWFTVINAEGNIICADFNLDIGSFLAVLETLPNEA